MNIRIVAASLSLLTFAAVTASRARAQAEGVDGLSDPAAEPPPPRAPEPEAPALAEPPPGGADLGGAAEEPPAWRLDIDLFTPGVGYTSEEGGNFLIAGQVGARLALRDGHGAYLDFGLHANIFSASYLLAEAGYLYRIRVVGDDRRGLGLDLQVGASGGTEAEDGVGRIGAHLGFSWDIRWGHFVFGLFGRGRMLFGGADVEAELTIHLRVTFGFFGD